MYSQSTILKPLEGKTGLLTGAYDFTGTVTACRLVLDCKVKSLHVVCRGGAQRLWSIWSAHLPMYIVHRMRQSRAITVHDGHVEQTRLGLDQDVIDWISDELHFIVHTASSNNLTSKVPQLLPSITDSSLALASFGLTCPNLKHFVYLSSAFANAHLHDPLLPRKVRVAERIHPLNDLHPLESADEEYTEAQKLGHVPEQTLFPFAQGYLKNLTERLLTNLFRHEPEKLLIIRPSLIGPAESFPCPHFEMPGSASMTLLAASTMIEPGRHVPMASPFNNADIETTIDEVPVDVVVNRLVVAMAQSYSGVFHAVAGDSHFSSGKVWSAIQSERLLFWKPKLSWNKCGARPKAVGGSIARIYDLMGTSLHFEENRTRCMWALMNDADRALVPLFMERDSLELHLRRKAIRVNVEQLLETKKLPVWLSSFLTRKCS